MRIVNMVVAIVVALGAAGAVFMMANAQTEKLENRIESLEGQLNDTKAELAKTRQELAKADTSKLQSEMNELSDALWGRVGDLTKKDAELESQIEQLATAPPAPAVPRIARGPEDPNNPNGDPDVKEVQRLVQGAGKLFKGMRDKAFDRQMERYGKELNLTESQSQDVKKILSEQADKMMDSIGKMLEGGEGMDRRTLMEELAKERDAALQEILTPEQFDKLKEMEKNQTQRWGGMGARRRGPQAQPQDGR